MENIKSTVRCCFLLCFAFILFMANATHHCITILYSFNKIQRRFWWSRSFHLLEYWIWKMGGLNLMNKSPPATWCAYYDWGNLDGLGWLSPSSSLRGHRCKTGTLARHLEPSREPRCSNCCLVRFSVLDRFWPAFQIILGKYIKKTFQILSRNIFRKKTEGEKKHRGKSTRVQFPVVQRKGGGEKVNLDLEDWEGEDLEN